ncbi:hypothetical protein [Pseudonocardia sp. TMWB2A]|uniref:hypothetical protein n=1 Tax=Pseudonocardia sp. TMWB2A TaxID=687430 RepID=UPI00307DB12C
MDHEHRLDLSLRTQLIAAAIVVLIASVLSVYGLSSIALSNFGFILTFLGLAVSLLGFHYTIQQLRKTASASEAANDAVRRLQQNLKNLEIMREIEAATKSSQETQSNLRRKQWKKSRDSLESVRDCLNKINAANLKLEDELKETVKDYCAIVVGISSEIDSVIDKKITANFINSIENLMKMDTFLLEIRDRVKGKIGEI